MAMVFGTTVKPQVASGETVATHDLGANDAYWNNAYINNLHANTINGGDSVILCAETPIPSSSVIISDSRITANHYLIKWNFTSSPDNAPPVSLSWTTGAGQITIVNNGGSSAENMQPLLIKV